MGFQLHSAGGQEFDSLLPKRVTKNHNIELVLVAQLTLAHFPLINLTTMISFKSRNILNTQTLSLIITNKISRSIFSPLVVKYLQARINKQKDSYIIKLLWNNKRTLEDLEECFGSRRPEEEGTGVVGISTRQSDPL